MRLAPTHYNVRVKRLLRILGASAVLISLLLLLFTLILWPRSYHVIDGIGHSRNGYDEDGSLIRRTRAVQTNTGHVVVSAGHFSSLLFDSVGKRSEEGLHAFQETALEDDVSKSPFIIWYHLGFGYARVESPLAFLKAWFIPCWFLTLIFSLLPTLWLLKFLRHHRRLTRNFCPTCGYDMRATPDRCPECGTPAVTMPS